MKRVQLDKIASVTLRLELERNAVLGDEIPAEAGTVVAARVLNAKTSYNTMEDVHGRMVALHPGDVILTGTPDGLADIHAGDEVVTEIEGVGRLVHRMADDAAFGRG